MSKLFKTLALSLALVSSASIADKLPQLADELQQRLAEADHYRLQEGHAKVTTEVVQYQSEQEKKRHLYNVYLRPQRESLVVFKAASEAGQKLLMLGDNYWLLMPNSRRPLRITPMQKLLGEASVGDVSTLTWSEDYDGEIGELSDWQGYSARHLMLNAQTKGASYQRIDLWVDEDTNFPLKADMYLKSGKLAKRAYFEPGERDGQTVVSTMTLEDAIQHNNTTVIYYQQVEARTLPDKYYNPAYLSRQDVSAL